MIGRVFKKELTDDERIAISNRHRREVRELVSSGDYQGAIRLSTKFQKRFPDHKGAICDSAIELSDAGEVPAAIEVLNRLNMDNPGEGLILLNLAVCYSRVEDQDRQLETAREAFAVDPERYEVADYISYILHEFDMIEEAKQVCEEFLSNSSDHQTLWFRLGCCEMYFGNSKDALVAFERSLEIDPDHFYSLANCAAALVGLKDWSNAEELVLRSLEINPDDGVTLCNLAQIYEAQDRDEDAYQMYVRSTEVDPEYERAYEDVERMREQLGFTDEHTG